MYKNSEIFKRKKEFLFIPQKQNIPVVPYNSQSYLGSTELIKNLTGILYETNITFSKT